MKRKFFTSAIFVSMAILLMRISGFIREIIMAYLYGAGMVTDAYVISFTIPGIVLGFVGGAVSSTYIPQYQRCKTDKSLLSSNLINILAVIGLVFSIIVSIFPKPLVYLFASQLEPETFALTVVLLRIMVWCAVPVLIISIFSTYLQMCGFFFRASIASLCINISIIIFIFVSVKTQTASFLAVGVVVGYFAQLMVTMVFCRKEGFIYRLYFNPKDENINDMLQLMLPIFLATSIGEISIIIDRNFASSLSSGTVSAINYAGKISSLVATFISGPINTVLYPKMTELAAGDDVPLLKRYLSGSIRNMFPLLLPFAVGLFILAEPAVRILFQRGAFTPEDTLKTAQCLRMYVLSIVAVNISPLFIRAFNAMKDTRLPAIISIVSVGVDIVLNILLLRPLQHMGLTLATSISALIMMGLLLFFLRRKIGPLGIFPNTSEIIKTALATMIMGGAVYAGYQLLPVMSGDATACIMYSFGLVLLGFVVYVLLHAVFRTVFFKTWWEQFRRSIFNRNV